MDVVVHEAVGERSPAKIPRDRTQELEVAVSIVVVPNDRSSLETSRGNVVDAVWNLEAEWPSHAR